MDNKGKSPASRQHHPPVRRGVEMSQWEVVLLCAVVEIRQQLAKQRRSDPGKEPAA